MAGEMLMTFHSCAAGFQTIMFVLLFTSKSIEKETYIVSYGSSYHFVWGVKCFVSKLAYNSKQCP